MKHLLYLLISLLYATCSYAQFTGAVWSGTRVYLPSGEQPILITLPGCTTQTAFTYVPGIECTFQSGSWDETRWSTNPDTVYDVKNTSNSFNGLAYGGWGPNQDIRYYDSTPTAFGYYSYFCDVDNDGTYEVVDANSPHITFPNNTSMQIVHSLVFSGFPFTSFVYRNGRLIISDVPITNPCPATVKGQVIDSRFQNTFVD